jgi:integrase
VRYFAGLRGSEAASLDESCIQPGRGFIEVTAAKAKTRRRRLVTIQPALAAWLDTGGTLPLGDVNTKLWNLTSALAFDWPRNVTRHSFVSYHLAAFGSASKTALEAGHTEQMLFNHYREIVTPGQAAEFWGIRPK